MNIEVIEIIKQLESILQEKDGENRRKLIFDFHDQFLTKDIEVEDDRVDEVVNNLAFDMELYEPNTEWRKEDHSYYGDDELETNIRTTLEKIKNLISK